MHVLKSYVRSMDAGELAKRVKANGGTLNVRLDGHDVALVRGTHFYLNQKDKQGLN